MQNPIPIIDPHLHLFALEQGEYHWLRPENPPHWPDKQVICHEFTEVDLHVAEPFELRGFVHIEAGFDNNKPWREIDWLENSCTLPFRSVAFADLTADNFAQTLQQLTQRSSVVGVRHILEQDALDILSAPKTKQRLGLLADNSLSVDAQLFLDDVKAVNELLSLIAAIPNLKIILTHAGLPKSLESIADCIDWQASIKRLADYPQIAIKVSGWEQQHRSWQYQQIQPFLEFILENFGEERVMLASNFPLSLWRKPYSVFWQLYSENISPDLQNKLLFNNANNWYRLNL